MKFTPLQEKIYEMFPLATKLWAGMSARDLELFARLRDFAGELDSFQPKLP
jgi:hypothetical protein